MNGSKENAAYGAFEKPQRQETVLNLATAQRMLPLVQRIITDLLQNQLRLNQLLPEQTRLDRQKRFLDWPERCRRYQIHEEIAAAERNLQDAKAELAFLGITLVDSGEGRIGFPTLVNGHKAYFSWRQGEENVSFWHFADETTRRSIPASWEKSADMSFSSRG